MTNKKSTLIRVNKNLNKFKINNPFYNRSYDMVEIVFALSYVDKKNDEEVSAQSVNPDFTSICPRFLLDKIKWKLQCPLFKC